MVELADIFRAHGREYLEKFGEKVLPSHKRAIADIIECRTETLGGHLMQCDCCAALDNAYRSCKNRSCPKCHKSDTQRWLEKRNAELLPVIYFHVVYTLPAELRRLVRKHQKILYPILMKAAAEALMKLAADPHYVGGKIGILAVLHTWTNANIFHPHVHCLVPGGGISPEKSLWLPSRKKFLVPVKALSPIFRAKFLEMAQNAMPCMKIPKAVWQKDWVVYCKPTVQGADKVLEYLGRYVHRIALTNSRVLKLEDGQVTFRYKKTQKRKKRWVRSWDTMILPVMEFMRRFLQHVLPKGFHKVRYYGFLHPSNRQHLRRVQIALANEIQPCNEDVEDRLADAITCRFCKKGTMIVVAKLPPSRQKVCPPQAIASHARSPP